VKGSRGIEEYRTYATNGNNEIYGKFNKLDDFQGKKSTLTGLTGNLVK